ncbi:DNA repair protein RecO [Candidatus Kaiserbacteria bacterium RIFCSPHIGHO2_02_FULL_49_11]|uniref:DNA repair protein RecO n=1 Tax=Candidatus Kaiserbacteria bacterium RIFCSPHIGHO2_02_FULL_49_11 TaxID=1798489 RepID=A0A1F6D1K5_9BACT|nr:MAG: DNA repair protein RecO [Candidatus Kaiserbacteria bacterium RIFCSPHIGHO2_02_FULL_49_11]
MAHRIETLDALVLGGMPVGEAHRSIDLLTPQLGRIRAVARSVRHEKSKLRFALQDFSHIKVSLVRGREVWRIVGAISYSNFYTDLGNRAHERDIVARLSALMRRLLPGEEENEELFSIVCDALTFLKETKFSESDIRDFECLTVLRILHNLGYLARDAQNASFLDTEITTAELISRISPLRLEMVKCINTSLHESQL